MTVGIGIAIGRLRKSKIFCIDPERINFAGSVDVVCWDKTGTLTLSGLSWVGIEPASDGVFIGFRESSSPPPPTASNVQEGALPEDARQIAKLGYLRKCLATCHGVNYIGGEISGHMVDMEMFKSTGWSFAVASEGNSAEDNANLSTIMLGQHKLDVVVKLVDSSSSIPNLAPAALYVVKRFEFDAAIQRNTVVCIEPNSIKSDNSGDILVFSKGSPEAIKNVCKPKSVPAKFHAIYQHYAAKGFYVLACAYKILNPDTSGSDFSQQSISTIRREKMEKDLTFLGFFILQNPIKQESFPTLNALSNADIRSVIITGDNSLTAIHVARELKLCQTVLMVEMSKNGSNELVFWQVPNDAHHPLAATTNDLGNKNGGSSNRLDVAAAGNSAGVSKPRASTLAAGIFSSMSTDDNTEMFPIEELPPYLLASKNQTDIAISGVALERLQDMYGQGFADWIICRSRIFSRAKPNHKTWIVERLQAEKFVVA